MKAVLLVIALLITGCATGHIVKEDTIKVGGAFALTGSAAELGAEEQLAAQLAIEESGMPIKLIVEDTKTTGVDTLSAIQKLISYDDVQVIIGPTWGDSFGNVVAPIGEQQHVVMVSPSAALEVVESEGNSYGYYYSTWYPLKAEIAKHMQYLKEHNIERVMVIHDQDSFNTYFSDLYVQAANGRVVNTMVVSNDDIDFKTVAAKIEEEDPQLLFVNVFQINQVGELLEELYVRNMDVPVFSQASMQNNNLLTHFGDVAEHRLYYTFPDVDSAAYEAFMKRYEKRYGRRPSSLYAATAYDATRMVIEALRKGSRSGDEIKALLDTIEMPGTVVEKLRFTPLGQITETKMALKTVEGGEFVLI